MSIQTETVIELEAAVSSSCTDGSSLRVDMTEGSTLSIEIDLARLDRRNGRDCFLRDGDAQAIGLRLAGIPVVRVLAQDAHRRVRGELLLHERAGSVFMQTKRLPGGAVRNDVGELVGDEHRAARPPDSWS